MFYVIQLGENIQKSTMNIVNTTYTSCFEATKLNLTDIGERLCEQQRTGCSYNPRRFSGAIIKIGDPRVSILLFSNGKMVVTGAKVRKAAREGVRKLQEHLEALGIVVPQHQPLVLKNMVASCNIGGKIDMYALSTENSKCSWDPELFIGAKYKFDKHKPGVAVIFASGKFNLTGCPTFEDMEKNYHTIVPILTNYLLHV
jgi:transcription initiation factor TFIID TATA-box-binding protein